jgi:transposase InsO family protein
MGTAEAIHKAGLHLKRGRKHKYTTTAGTFTTTQKSKIHKHRILELNSRRVLKPHTVQVTPGTLGRYDFIFGRDYLNKYGIDLCFSQGVIEWDGAQMDMKPAEEVCKQDIDIQACLEEVDETDVIEQFWNEHYAQQIMDSKYEKTDLLRVTQAQDHLTIEQREALHELLSKYEDLFQGQLGEWPGEELSVELTPDAVPYHCGRPIRIPHIHMKTLKKEVDRLVEIGVLEVVQGDKAGPWCAPSFITAKKADAEGNQRVRFITDFRELNKYIQRKPWPMPHINDMIQDVGHYKYVTALDLSMGYYHFKLDAELSELSTFMLPFGLYKYLRLPMGLSISPDIFQERMSKLFADLPYMKVFLDDLLIFSNGTFEDHLEKVKEALRRLHEKNLAVNASKSFWAVQEVDYLGFHLTPHGVEPQPKKIDAMMRIEPPKTKKQLRRFIGLVNYYRFMFQKRSHIMVPLTELVSKNVPFRWTARQQAAFEEMKRTISRKVLLSFPDYSKRFEMYIDASDRQIGAVLKQGTKTLAFFSKKLTSQQMKYGVGEKEMLSMVEALKEFRTMIFGYPIDVYTDHLNWTHDKILRNACVMRWRLFIEDFAPTLHYIKGKKNVEADALSRLHKVAEAFANLSFGYAIKTRDEAYALMNEVFEEAPWRKFHQPITFAEISRKQKNDPYVLKLQDQAPDRLGEIFEDIGRKTGPDRVLTESSPVDGKSRIVVPLDLRARLLEWYHTKLVHPGVHRLYNTLRQHYTWPKMMDMIRKYTKKCDPCQKGKRGLRGVGKIPMKDVETEPWKDIAVDCSGPWAAKIDGKKVIFWSLTIIDVFTSWVEIHQIESKDKYTITTLFEQEWLRRYPRPSRVIFDAGGEFDNREFRNRLITWFIKPEPITVKNPRANAIVERMHKILGDMLRTQLASRYATENPVEDLLSAAAYALRATVHGVTQYTPAQLVFSKDMILRTNVEANMELVRLRREAAVRQNNLRENKRRIKHTYHVGDKVLILSGGLDPKLQLHSGPYKVVGVNQSTGTLSIQRRNYVEPINIRNVRPYFGDS